MDNFKRLCFKCRGFLPGDCLSADSVRCPNCGHLDQHSYKARIVDRRGVDPFLGVYRADGKIDLGFCDICGRPADHSNHVKESVNV